MSGKKQAKLLAEIYEVKITLLYSEPPIWRHFAVRGDVTLAELHEVIQAVMGWTDSHLHQFVVGDNRYSAFYPGMDWDLGEDMIDEATVKLHNIVEGPGARFLYEYDFGDCWQHELKVEKITPSEAGVRYPTCLAGKRACPPENCGGIGGYEDFLEAIADPKHKEHKDLLEWVGGAFDPEAFDLKEINRILREIR